jgi:ankyrin repeat protein
MRNCLVTVSSKRTLLDKGADVNAQGGEYGNALSAASFGGHEQAVKMLLDKGADVNAQGGPYGNALQVASRNGHREIVTLLQKHSTSKSFE